MIQLERLTLKERRNVAKLLNRQLEIEFSQDKENLTRYENQSLDKEWDRLADQIDAIKVRTIEK